jgi:hypothetical protein
LLVRHRPNFSHARPVALQDVQIPGGIEIQRYGSLQLSLRRRDIVLHRRATAGYGGEDTALVQFANAPVAGVGDEQVSRCIEANTGRKKQARGKGRAIVAGQIRLAVPRDGGDDAARVDFADAMRKVVGEKQIARRIEGDAKRTLERRLQGWSSIAAESRLVRPCKFVQNSVGRDSRQSETLSEIDAPIRTDGHRDGPVDGSLARIDAGYRGAIESVPRDHPQGAVGVHAIDLVVQIVGDVQVSSGIEREICSRANGGVQRGLSVGLEGPVGSRVRLDDRAGRCRRRLRCLNCGGAPTILRLMNLQAASSDVSDYERLAINCVLREPLARR